MRTSALERVPLLAPGDPSDPGDPVNTSTAPPPTSGAPSSGAPSSGAPSDGGGGGGGLVPAVQPNMNSTGMSGFTELTNTIAGWTLLGCLAGFLISVFVFVLGPALGLRQARQYGAIGMIGALGAAALVAVAAAVINLAYSMFSGGS
jgi:hypothetical protein